MRVVFYCLSLRGVSARMFRGGGGVRLAMGGPSEVAKLEKRCCIARFIFGEKRSNFLSFFFSFFSGSIAVAISLRRFHAGPISIVR